MSSLSQAAPAQQQAPAQSDAPQGAQEIDIEGAAHGNAAAAALLTGPQADSSLLSQVTAASFGPLDWLFEDEPTVAQNAVAQALDNPTVRATRAASDLLAKSPDEQKAAMAAMDDESYKNLVENLPQEQRAKVLGKLLDNAGTDTRKAEMWKNLHKAQSADAVAAKIAKIDPSTPEGQSEIAALQRVAQGESKEADEELEHMKSTGDYSKLTDTMKRKQAELALEVKWGINLTNDAKDETDPSKEPRKRRVWEEKDLAWFERELPKISEKQRHDVTEFRRADKGYVKDASGNWVQNGARAQHWGDSGVIEMFDGAFATPGALIHEVGHNVDKNNPAAVARYKAAAGFEDYNSRAALETKLASNGMSPDEIKRQLDGVASKKGEGAYNDRSVTIDGKVYQLNRDGTTWSSYNADAIPSRDGTQKTTDGWGDEWDYARTGPADLFAEHYKLAARDPVRLHQDMIEGPEKRLAAMKANGAGAAAIAEQQKKVDTLKSQWDIMRGDINGVTPKAVSDASSSLPDEQRAAFEAQAARCCTGDQLAKLAEAYRNGDQVDKSAINSVKNLVPADQRAAFEADAKGCFTQEQLSKLVGAYAERRRYYGQWKGGQAGEIGRAHV